MAAVPVVPLPDTGGRPGASRRRRAAPALWVLALLAVAPAMVPVALLAWAALQGATTGGIGVARLAELMFDTTRRLAFDA